MIYDETELLNMVMFHSYVQWPEAKVVSSSDEIWICWLYMILLRVILGIPAMFFIRIQWVNLGEDRMRYRNFWNDEISSQNLARRISE